MELPSAALVHDTPGRIRLRISEKRGDRAYFDAARRALSGCTGVRHVSASALTGSLVVLHAGELSAVMSFAREQALFELSPATPPDTFRSIQSEVQRLDQTLRRASNERWGVAGATFYSLLGASIWQAARGRVLPPTVTLLFQALNVFRQALEAEEATRARPNKH